MNLAALILTYNRKEILKSCIEAVLLQKATEIPDIIVVDNGSSDGTSELFSGKEAIFKDERIHYFNTGHNTGCAGGFTFGMRKAADLGYDYIWMMDDDCIPSETALAELVGFAEKHVGQYGFLSSKVLWKDGSISLMNIQRTTLTRNVKDFNKSIVSVTMASFASLLIPIRVIRDVGLPYSKFFIWTDDWEYTRRISMKYPCFLITRSEVTHYIKDNSKADIATASSDRLPRFRYLYRNDVFLYRREGIKGIVYESLRLSIHIARILLSDHVIKEKIKRSWIVINGTTEGFSFYPTPERLSAK